MTKTQWAGIGILALVVVFMLVAIVIAGGVTIALQSMMILVGTFVLTGAIVKALSMIFD